MTSGPNAPAGNLGLPSNGPAPAIKPQGKQARTKAIKARTAPSCVQALPAASKESVPTGFTRWLRMVGGQASTRAKPALFVPPDQPGGLTQFLV